ncbi:MAG TPA: hypothetical protein VEB40_10245 [Flavipsychrobacter sp.]|nr:hypothetical protein [Flavipsychrobacter sp.]
MKATIHIECETGGELYRHLLVLADQLKIEIRAVEKKGIAKKPLILEDNNCYGWHEAKV